MTSTSSGRTLAVAEVDTIQSDPELSENDMSSGDDSTDIDAVVKEYRDRIQVYQNIAIAVKRAHCVYISIDLQCQVTSDAVGVKSDENFNGIKKEKLV